MPELSSDRLLQSDLLRQPSEFFLYEQPRPEPAAVLSVAEPSPRDPSNPESPEVQDAADPAARLEHCINLQTRLISLLEEAQRVPREIAQPGITDPANNELLGLLQQAIRYERTIVKDYRALRAEIGSLRIERDQLEVALRLTEALSLTDELTGLPNRRGFVRRLDQEISRSQRSGQPLTMVLLDIDNFKDINDAHGHYVGDMVLRCYAQSMVREFRQHDLLARYGGEEFVLLLPETLLDEAINAAKKLSRRIQREPLVASGTHINLPTFSAGIASRHPGEPASAFINRADQALYLAKRKGRNRIESHE